jgi:hypothetical protein
MKNLIQGELRRFERRSLVGKLVPRVMNDNNIYSGNQHHKKCFSDGSCKLNIKIQSIENIYSVCTVFTYWYMDIYDIPEKL